MPPGENLKGQWIAPSFIASVQSVAAAQDRMAAGAKVEQIDTYKARVLASHGLLAGEWAEFERLRRTQRLDACDAADLIKRRRADRDRYRGRT